MKFIALAIFATSLLVTSAEAKKTLTVYTYDSFVSEWGPGSKIKANFESICDCEIKWVAPGDGVALLNRLKLEGSKTEADVVLGLDTSLVAEALETGLFAKHDVPLSKAKLPVAWTDEYFMPFDYAHFAVVYDSQTIKQVPKSLDDLVNGNPNEKIILEDPRSSTPGLGFLLWMKSVYGDKAADAWKKLKGRVLTVTPGWSEAYALFLKGQAPMVLSYTISPAYHIISENTDRYKAAAFSEGHYLQIEVGGVIADSKKLNLARSFLAFMMESGFQDEIPTGNWMLPAGTVSKPLPKPFEELVQPSQSLLMTSQEVAQNRRQWIDEWLNAVSQ